MSWTCAPPRRTRPPCRAYLERNLRPGERVELWNLWVGEGPARGVYCSGRVENLAVDTLEQLEEQEQTCMTIER